MALDVATLRQLFRHFQAFRSAYETDGVEEITDYDGVVWNIFDLEYLYEQLPLLPQRQHQAIELCFVQNLKESEAAVAMGVSYTNPVCIYANNGLARLIEMIQAGRLPRFSPAEFMVQIVEEVTVTEVDLREEGAGASATSWCSQAPGGRGEPADPGVLAGSHQAFGQGRHPHPLEGSRQAS